MLGLGVFAENQIGVGWLPGAPALLDVAAGRVGRAMLSMGPASAARYSDDERDLPSPETQASEFEPEKLENCPFGSFGFKCWAFRRACNLRPLKCNRRLDGTDAARILAARRVLLHDALHVLLNFDADPPGEVGVFSFVAAQRYSPRFEREARTLAQLYVTLLPWLRDDLQAAEYRGRELAAGAPPLLALPLEREWNAPLTQLQAQLRLKTLKTLAPMKWDAP